MTEITGYENYTIDETGNVWSKYTNIFMKPFITKDGYLRIGLSKNGKEKLFLLHRLIALEFIPNPDNKKEVDHINRNPLDYRVENLRWLTPSQNSQGVSRKNKENLLAKIRIEFSKNKK